MISLIYNKVKMAEENQIKSILQSISKNINEDLKDFTPLQSISKRYNQEPSHVALLVIVVMMILTSIGLFQHIVVTVFGLLYPAYMSFKVLSL